MPPSAAIPLRPGSSVDESSAMQAQHLLAMAQRLQGMAVSLGPASSLPPLLTPEVPIQPTLALQAHHTTLLPLPLPQLLAASVMGAPFLPPAFTQHCAQHATPSPSGQSPGLAGAQHPSSLLPRAMSVPQLLLQNTAPYTVQRAIYSSPLHQ